MTSGRAGGVSPAVPASTSGSSSRASCSGAAPDPEFRQNSSSASTLERGRSGRTRSKLHRRLAEIDPDAARADPLERPASHDSGARNRATRRGRLRTTSRARVRQTGRIACCISHSTRAARSLNERIERRCSEMIDAGLLQEVRNLRERGYGPELPSMQSIGYRHVQPVVAGQRHPRQRVGGDAARHASLRAASTHLASQSAANASGSTRQESERGHELVAAFTKPALN